MAKPAILDRPDIEAKRKENNRFIALVTRKAEVWGEANGYADLMRDIKAFMAAYKAAHEKPDFYSQQTPERLMEMITIARQRMDKAMEALTAKSPGYSNGHR